jgi:SAM-dependent methyltransferase
MPVPVVDAASRRPLRRDDFADWTTYYWTYQFQLVTEYLVPRLRAWGVWSEGARVLDVGCGDGGASTALAEHGARVDGFDLDTRRVRGGAERARARGIDLRLATADVTDSATLDDFAGPYDLILFRDVLEHIPDVDAALRNCRERLADGGGIVVIYPPYWSPYGGHQQILHPPKKLGVRWAKLPFVHWLGLRTWRALARGVEGDDPEWEEIETIRRACLTVHGLRRRARDHGLYVAHARRYLLRPTFRLRYGTPVLGAGWLGALPGVRELLVTGSWELLRAAPRDGA